MIEELLLHTSETGPRSRSKPSAGSAAAMRAVLACPTGIGSQGTVLIAMHTAPPSWSVAATSRSRRTAAGSRPRPRASTTLILNVPGGGLATRAALLRVVDREHVDSRGRRVVRNRDLDRGSVRGVLRVDDGQADQAEAGTV